VQRRLRQNLAALLFGVGLTVAAMPVAQAQTWGGTTSTGDYNTNTEWTPATAPVAAGQSAVFDTGGTDTVNVSAAIAPDSWTFNANAQSYSISGANVTFSAGGGITSNANTGQFVGIGNNIGGASATVFQNGASTLQLSGNNTYGGGTTIASGTLQVAGNNSIGTSQVTVFGGTFQPSGVTDLTFTNDFFMVSAGTVDVNGTTLTLSGAIFGPGTLTITDSSLSFGTAALQDNNSFGALNVVGARVQVNTNNSIGNGLLTLDNGGLQAAAAGLTFFNFVKLNTGGGILDSNGNTLSMAGNISDGNGPGALTIIDSTGGGVGITELAGTNTYTGGTTVINTTLQVTNINSIGTGTVTLDNARFQTDGLGGNLTFTNNFQINNSASGSIIDASGVELTIAGNISDGIGAGKLTVDDRVGGGKVVLLGNNTYTGGTEICFCGTLQLADATHTASLVGDITNFGTFNVVNANLSGVTSLTNDGGLANFLNATSAGSMTINNINGAQLVFGSLGGTDTATAGNATIVNDGSTVGFLANATAGNANITNQNGAQLAFGVFGGTDKATAGNATIVNDASLVGFFANTNAGTAKITNQNGAVTFFIDQASAGSATIVNQNGLISFGTAFGTDTPTAGNATITNNAGGLTQFNANSTAGNAKIVTNDGGETDFFDNANGGKAQFITVGTGFVDFSGSLGPNGDGRITAGSIAGSGIYYIGAGNTLVVGGNNLTSEVTGVIADFNPCGCFPGPGSLEKVGTGNLILSGINTYTGSTTVNGGILSVNGSIAASSSVTVNAGGTLGGNGIVSSTTINGGTLAPGNSIGLLTVQGNLVFTAAASYMVEISPTNADRTNVTGIATLGSATVKASFGPELMWPSNTPSSTRLAVSAAPSIRWSAAAGRIFRPSSATTSITSP
jgi:autotransporter-associated beta strand protein